MMSVFSTFHFLPTIQFFVAMNKIFVAMHKIIVAIYKKYNNYELSKQTKCNLQSREMLNEINRVTICSHESNQVALDRRQGCIIEYDKELETLFCYLNEFDEKCYSNECYNNDEFKEKLSRCETVLQLFALELRGHVTQTTTAASWKVKLKKYRGQLKLLKQKLASPNNNNNNNDRDQLDMKHGVGIGSFLDTNEVIINHGDALQARSLEALQSIAINIQQTKQLAAMTAIKIDEQTNQISAIHSELYEIDDQMDRTKKIFARILRTALSNKYLWVLIGFIFIGIVLIILVKLSLI